MRRLLIILFLTLILSTSWGTPPVHAGENDARWSRLERMYEDYRREFPNIAEVSADTLMEWLNAGNVVLIDVRREAERRVSSLPRAIPAHELPASLENHPGLRVVVFCTVGYRSGKYVRSLQRTGIAAYNLRGGILAWVHRGGVLEHNGTPTHRIHVYGRKWDLAPIGYEAVW